MSKADQYARSAAGWSDAQYADARAYLAQRARLVVGLGPRLVPGETVLDLACGDGGLGSHLRRAGLLYRGVDATPEMAAEAERRLGAGVAVGDLNEFVPAEPVAATTLFRALYYVVDRPAFFRRVAGFTSRKLVFDLDPRRYEPATVLAELRAAGFDRFALRPFFVPQTRALPRPLGAALRGVGRVGPIARLVLRRRFTYVVAAWRDDDR
ncbi:hypothetical protein Gocc_1888 [Gaiella occulta]|uniref:Methyltransferase domain-containing protein n=1 Tax=Gaiella occulta TaxID=1002870 RepID=A0A7M2YW02_9ACTN|nr:class I SAM-dependent methyltransferase [Gaiella occulta]RDI74312.1 hypothetical protein Gocc_1888 [Gaiella occulta]